jgi:hypothetical protein
MGSPQAVNKCQKNHPQVQSVMVRGARTFWSRRNQPLHLTELLSSQSFVSINLI